MKIGIDFGSTYSTFSVFDHQNGLPRAIALQNDRGSIPTVLSYSDYGDIAYGTPAKSNIGDDSYQVFEAFKMLLTESKQRMLEKRGYTAAVTPRLAAKQFLQLSLRQAMVMTESQSCEELVICVPETWTKAVRTIDGRAILRDIIVEIAEDQKSSIDLDAGHIRVVSEPEAASSYFAYEYQRSTGNPYNGHLLLIDYGGGTLDITLTRVRADGANIDIKYCVGDGAGENHPDEQGRGTIGVAGIAYMQGVITYAMRGSNILGEDEEPDYSCAEFAKAVKRLEEHLLTNQSEINSFFSRHENRLSELEDNNESVIRLTYREQGQRRELAIQYKHLYTAYKNIIEPVLAEKLTVINDKIYDLIGIDPTSPAAGGIEGFKIALVGGFGSYYLVQNQIQRTYNFVARDTRTAHINIENREKAISLGAALLAEGIVTLRRIARYSIGFILQDSLGNGRQVTRRYFGIRYGQEIQPNQVCYIHAQDGNGNEDKNSLKAIARLANNITELAIDSTPDQSATGIYQLKQKFIERLNQIDGDCALTWACGFSMDENEFLTIHLEPHPTLSPGRKIPAPVPLSIFSELIEPFTGVREFHAAE